MENQDSYEKTVDHHGLSDMEYAEHQECMAAISDKITEGTPDPDPEEFCKVAYKLYRDNKLDSKGNYFHRETMTTRDLLGEIHRDRVNGDKIRLGGDGFIEWFMFEDGLWYRLELV